MRVILRATPVVAACLLVYAAIWHPWGLLYGLGVHPYPGPQTPWTYQMWSGIIPSLTVLSLFGSLGAAYHLHNCHADRCWRIGKHRIEGTPWCTRHMRLATTERTQLAVMLSIEAAVQSLAELAVLTTQREARS